MASTPELSEQSERTSPQAPVGAPPSADLQAPVEVSPPVDLDLIEHDMRRRRPPALSFLLRMDTARRASRIVVLLTLDAIGVYAAVLAALQTKSLLRGGATFAQNVDHAYHYATFAFLLTALLFARSGLYGDRGLRPGLRAVVSSLFWVMVVALIYAKADGQHFQSYYVFWGSLIFAVAIVGALRWGYDRLSGVLLRAAGYHRRAVLVGTGEHIDAVAHALVGARGTPSPIHVVGFVSLEPRPANGLRALGSLDELPTLLDSEAVDEVIIADPAFPQQQAVELVDVCHRRGVRVKVAPSTMEILVHRAEFVPGEAVPLFELRSPVFDGFDWLVKRAFDVVGAALLLLLLSPFLAIAALAVRLTSRGPVLYHSVRPGIGGQPFACLKFRTMLQDAHELQPELEQRNEAGGALFKIREDPRITRVGRFLRRFSIDELPQLWNVLRGDMSLVGPRPLPQRDYERLEDWHRKRYLVLPGITGLWQVSGRSELDFDDLVRLDFLYLEHWSVSLDLSILVKTIPAVVRGRGAF
ncbi:MAG: sugar transferase [Solirubrobacteraceae bacterium]|nr:sugar transferase [Solirubrobacteraceae bacterium]